MTLAEVLLADGTPMPIAKVLNISVQLVDRLRAAGAGHGGLSLGTIDLAADGRVVLLNPGPGPGPGPGAAPADQDDLRSLGAVLYELLTGHHVAPGETPPPVARFNCDAPAPLVAAVSRLLEPDPAKRYQSMHEVRSDLLPMLDAPAPSRPVLRQRPRVPAGMLALTIAIATAAAVIIGCPATR